MIVPILIKFQVYVANLLPDSIAAMSLLIGECIVDVEGELITSIPQVICTFMPLV